MCKTNQSSKGYNYVGWTTLKWNIKQTNTIMSRQVNKKCIFLVFQNSIYYVGWT